MKIGHSLLPILVALLLFGPINGHSAETDSLEPTPEVLSQWAFTELYIQRIQGLLEGGLINRGEEGALILTFADGDTRTAFVDNAYAAYLAEPSDLEVILDHYAAASVERPSIAAEGIDIQRLLPCVRSLSHEHLPLDPDGIASRPIAGDLIVYYCVDFPDQILFPNTEELHALADRHPDFHDRAVQNVPRLAAPPDFVMGDGRAMVTNGGDYEASLILDDAVWQRLHGELGPDIVFGVPTRDLFISVDGRQPSQVDWLRAQVQNYCTNGAYPISCRLYRRTGQGITAIQH
ncbi:MAG: DUF1444 family protein [Pseudomonadota bacterium]